MIARRKMILNTARIGASTCVSAAAMSLLWHNTTRHPSSHTLLTEPAIIRPPGAQGEADFLSACIHCQRCTDACPRGTIQLASLGDPAPYGTPFIIPTERGCDLCLECTDACPTEALAPLEDKRDVDMGLAVVDDRLCVSANGTGICGACHTACPLKNDAITQGSHNKPIIHEDHCVGCGLCEEACIIDGTKAIRVFSKRGVA